jgi:hypothetical protein
MGKRRELSSIEKRDLDKVEQYIYVKETDEVARKFGEYGIKLNTTGRTSKLYSYYMNRKLTRMVKEFLKENGINENKDYEYSIYMYPLGREEHLDVIVTFLFNVNNKKLPFQLRIDGDYGLRNFIIRAYRYM